MTQDFLHRWLAVAFCAVLLGAAAGWLWYLRPN